MEFAQTTASSGKTSAFEQRVLTLQGGPGAARAARSAVESMRGGLSPETHANLRLLVTEIVGNAVRHGGMTRRSSIELSFEGRRDVLHVEIADSGPGFEAPTAIESSAADSGWGLHLLNRLASVWGVESRRGARVWFQLPVTGFRGR